MRRARADDGLTARAAFSPRATRPARVWRRPHQLLHAKEAEGNASKRVHLAEKQSRRPRRRGTLTGIGRGGGVDGRKGESREGEGDEAGLERRHRGVGGLSEMRTGRRGDEASLLSNE